MEGALYHHHLTVSTLIDEFEVRCQDHFTWLEEVLQVAAENYQRRDVEVLPKTPSVKKKTRNRKKNPVILSSEDEDFVDSRPSNLQLAKKSSKSIDDNDVPSAASSVDATDDECGLSARSTRSTRSTRSNTSAKCNRSKGTRSLRGKSQKKVAIKEGEDEDMSMSSLPVPGSMESITEVDEERMLVSPQESIKNPALSLLQSFEESSLHIKKKMQKVNATSENPALILDSVNKTPVMDNVDGQSPVLTPKPLSSHSTENRTPVLSKALNTPLQRLKNTLTPVSPKVRLEHLPKAKRSIDKSSGSEAAGDENSDDQVASSIVTSVKDKVCAYDSMLTKLTPALNSTMNSPSTSVPNTPPTVYKSSLNVTLTGSNEPITSKTRIIRQISNSPQTKRLSQTRHETSMGGRRSSSTRKSDRIRQQASRMSLAKRKSFLMKNRTSIVEEPVPKEEHGNFSSPDKFETCEVDTSASAEGTAKPEELTPECDTPRRTRVTGRTTPVTRNTCRKRQLTTDSDSSNGTPGNAKKRVRPERMAQSPRVKHLKHHEEKSSDSEYVTDDSDVPPSPVGKKGSRFRTPPRPQTLVQRSTPKSMPSPGFSGSFIKRNTPKTLTIKERQEQYKKELVQKKQQEERRLEKIRVQKQQEVERQRRKREERHQQVQAKRLAQQRAQTEQSLTSQKSKEKRGSAILREQREKAELDRQKRVKKQAEAEERRRQEEEKRLAKIREKDEETKMVQAMMQRRKEYEEQEKQKRLQEEKRLADEKKLADEKRIAEEKRREQEAELKRQREEAEAERAKSKHKTSLNTSLNESLSEHVKRELQSYNIDDIRSDDDTDDEDAPKKEIPPWASGHRMKAAMIHQHYKQPNIDEIFPPCVLLRNPDLTIIFPNKLRPRFDKRTSSAIWSPIQKHFISPAHKSFVKKIPT